MKKFKVIPIPQLYGLISWGNDPKFVKEISPYKKEKKIKHSRTISILYTMVFEKGLKRDKTTYLAPMVKVKLDVQIKIPNSVAMLLVKLKDVMQPKYPNDFPLRREIDCKIGLIPG